ncbi:isoprenoid synthase domain-containing protein [Mycena pura]|uniref:Isoprenoid synthase domain-containing protein n=1 Tax=Mycena pura TaxID=153505 RepID=A0AAD6VKP1_9AGAR|nr:isoprenoid synthase domain-containing protein [Mycena pura]
MATLRIANATEAKYARGVNVQAKQRDSGFIPDFESYIALWRDTSGCKPYDLDIDLPDFVVGHPVILALNQSTNDLVTCSNDIFSYNVEQSRSDTHNMIVILMQYHGDTLQSAVDYVGKLCRFTIDTFQHDRESLPRGVRRSTTWSNDMWGGARELDCRTDEHGIYKGYGFVHYETAEAADSAIKAVNGMLLNDKYVGHHISRKEQQSKLDEMKAQLTNLYVKNLDPEVSEEEFEKLAEYGTVTSAVVIQVDDEGKARDLDSSTLRSHDAAQMAVDALNDTEVNGRKLYIGRAQKKADRVNLHIKSLEDDVAVGMTARPVEIYLYY